MARKPKRSHRLIALIPTCTIRQMLANVSGVEFKKTVSKFRKRKRKSLSCFHVHFAKRWVVQRRQRNVWKCVMHVQSCCFVNLNLFLFCRSSCCRLCRCLSSPIINAGGTALTDKRRDQGRASPWGLYTTRKQLMIWLTLLPISPQSPSQCRHSQATLF